MVDQTACSFYGEHALVSEYDGMVNTREQAHRLAGSIGDKRVAVLLNHGLITLAGSVEQAIVDMLDLERTCEISLALLPNGVTWSRSPTRPHSRRAPPSLTPRASPCSGTPWFVRSRLRDPTLRGASANGSDGVRRPPGRSCAPRSRDGWRAVAPIPRQLDDASDVRAAKVNACPTADSQAKPLPPRPLRPSARRLRRGAFASRCPTASS